MGPDGKVFVCNNGGLNWLREGNTCRPHSQAHYYSDSRTSGSMTVAVTTR